MLEKGMERSRLERGGRVMADKTTSHSKEVIMDSYQASLLERYGEAKNHFDHARDPMISQQIKDMNNEKVDSQGRESFMVKEDMPKQQARPSEEFARGQDGKTFDDKWQREQNDAAKDQRHKDLVERYKDYEPSSEQNNDRGNERDFDNSR